MLLIWIGLTIIATGVIYALIQINKEVAAEKFERVAAAFGVCLITGGVILAVGIIVNLKDKGGFG
jgi:hypothetical protein